MKRRAACLTMVIGRYVASWAIDIARENAGEGTFFEPHHNLYGRLVWKVNNDSELSLEYGVVALGLAGSLFSTDPTGDFYPTLDTQHLVRLRYSSTF